MLIFIDAYSSFNAIEGFPKLDVPVYFFTGANDYNNLLELTKKYYQNLNTVEWKRINNFSEVRPYSFSGSTVKNSQKN